MSATAAPVPARRLGWAIVLVWVALTIAIALAIPRAPWADVFARVGRADVILVVAAILANWLILLFWAAEWRLLLPSSIRATFKQMFEVVSITGAVLNTVPFFVGEASGFALLSARLGLSAAASASMIAMDQLLVGIAKLAVFGAAVLVAPIPAWLRAGVTSLLILVPVLAIALGLAAQRWREHLHALRDRNRWWRLVGLALLKKTAELLAILLVQRALGVTPSLASGLLVLAAVSITTMLPVAPANLGVYEATVFAVYRTTGVSADGALGLALVQHACFLVPPIVTGYLMLTLSQLRLRRGAS